MITRQDCTEFIFISKRYFMIGATFGLGEVMLNSGLKFPESPYTVTCKSALERARGWREGTHRQTGRFRYGAKES